MKTKALTILALFWDTIKYRRGETYDASGDLVCLQV